MKTNKNNSVKKVTSSRFAGITTTTINHRSASEKKQSDFTNGFRILEENNKITRRYSFDDNGGGYQGL